MSNRATVIDMQDPIERKWAQLSMIKAHLKLQSKGMKHTRLNMSDLLQSVEKHLHEGKRVYPRSRKGCEQAVETISLWQEEILSEIAAKHGYPIVA